MSIVGTVIGASAMGYHPLGELMYIDFATVAMEQIANQAGCGDHYHDE